VEPTLLCGVDLNGTTFTETYDELRKNQYHVIHFNGHPSVNLASPRNCGLICGRCGTFRQRQLKNFAAAGDVIMAIGGSGNSPSVLRSVEYGNSIGCQTIALTGRDGGKLGPLAQLNDEDFGQVFAGELNAAQAE
jgi:hypothetical protein